jgi:hypothetical protein
VRAARHLGAALFLALLTADGALGIESPSGIDPRLRLAWDVRQTRGGRPEIDGYIYNDYMRAASDVRLLVETLDENGRVIGCAYGFVLGVVPPFNRAPFDVPLRTAGASYRIRVTAYDWRDGVGGGG